MFALTNLIESAHNKAHNKMFLSWLRQRRRRRLLAEPFPETWLHYLNSNVAHYSHLPEVDQAQLRDDLRVFIAEKRWEGCGGLQLTDEMKVTIAAQACLLVLHLPRDDPYARVTSILIYPRGFLIPSQYRGTDVVFDRGHAVLGQAVYRGPVIISWEHALSEGRNPQEGRNVVFHEFAHQLDMLNGMVDGTPDLRGVPVSPERWHSVMGREFRRLSDASEQGRATLLDEYGATNEGEFFAVATECFFDRPLDMHRRHPRLYELLRDYYRQDPAARASTERKL
jgi:Mlc titration factor MtfA (ptsG expression regulator)